MSMSMCVCISVLPFYLVLELGEFYQIRNINYHFVSSFVFQGLKDTYFEKWHWMFFRGFHSCMSEEYAFIQNSLIFEVTMWQTFEKVGKTCSWSNQNERLHGYISFFKWFWVFNQRESSWHREAYYLCIQNVNIPFTRVWVWDQITTVTFTLKNKNKHNAELQRADPGNRVTG